MFDTIVNPSSGVPRPRWTTTALSAVRTPCRGHRVGAVDGLCDGRVAHAARSDHVCVRGAAAPATTTVPGDGTCHARETNCRQEDGRIASGAGDCESAYRRTSGGAGYDRA